MDNCIKPIQPVKVTGEGIADLHIPVPQWADIADACTDLGDAVCLEYVNSMHKQRVTNKARTDAQEGLRAKDKMIRAAVKAAGSDPVKLSQLGEVIRKINES